MTVPLKFLHHILCLLQLKKKSIEFPLLAKAPQVSSLIKVFLQFVARDYFIFETKKNHRTHIK